jgi:uncharacterized protein
MSFSSPAKFHYAAPWWLPGGNAQTIWSALFSKRHVVRPGKFERHRYSTPDGDFIDIDWCRANAEKAVLVIFHGLEGSSRSHYVEAFAAVALAMGWTVAVPHFRGCSGEINWAPRAYHSGDAAEIDWMLELVMQAGKDGPTFCIGVSLGGNALAQWASTASQNRKEAIRAIATISAPLDLAASGHAIGQGFNRYTYNRMFLKTMKRKAEAKWSQYPGLFDLNSVKVAETIFEFDNAFTAPVHGFKNADHYWAAASAKPRLERIEIPSLLVNAINDPFVPAKSLPNSNEVGKFITLWQPKTGGHVGFTGGPPRGSLVDFSFQVMSWLHQQNRIHYG